MANLVEFMGIPWRFGTSSPGGTIVGTALLMFLLTTANPACAVQSKHDATQDLTELSLQELMQIEVNTVYGASKFEQKLTEAPAAVSIVTASDIKRYGYRTLADIMGSVRGFYTTYDRNYHYLVSRQPCNVVKNVVSILHNQPRRIGYEEIHRDAYRRGA